MVNNLNERFEFNYVELLEEIFHLSVKASMKNKRADKFNNKKLD